MRKALLKILDNIYNDIEDNNSSISLMVGGPGIMLFKLYYLKHIKNNDLNDDIISNIQELSEASISYDNVSSFCNGQAGINWFFSFLYNEDYIDRKDYKIITSNDFLLAETGLDYLTAGVYDFLHGGVGIAHYILYAKGKKSLPFFDKFHDNLNALMDRGNTVLGYFNFELQDFDPNKINPGLSHGLASVLKLCMQCYENGICKRKSKHLSKRIINFLMENTNADKTHSYFPFIYDFINNDQKKSRLSWCNGDLGIAYIMYQYGLMFNDDHVTSISLEILHHSANRRTDSETGVNDAGLCHGSSGIAHIFSKLWRNTKDPTFHDATIYWFQKTIDYSIYKDGLAGFKTHSKANKISFNDSGLLTGVAGIGLAILSYLFHDYSWDYCLMLND